MHYLESMLRVLAGSPEGVISRVELFVVLNNEDPNTRLLGIILIR